MGVHNINYNVHLSFRDILLVPCDDDWCRIMSRHDPDISSMLCTKNEIVLKIPVIASPMDTIVGSDMVHQMRSNGSLAIIPRYIGDEDEINKQLDIVKKQSYGPIACAVGVNRGDTQKTHDHVKTLVDAGVDIICIDIANGNHSYVESAIKTIGSINYKYRNDISLIVGNVATGLAALRLAKEGVDAVKVGIGGGSICSTRIKTGFGIPVLSSVMNCYKILRFNGYNTAIISDGGIRCNGDIAKAIWAGADFVMCGYLFAGHDECPGGNIYRGMSSKTTHKRDDISPEGVDINVPCRGKIANTLNDIKMSLKASLSMANADNLDKFRKNVRAIRVSTMSDTETQTLSDY